MVSILLGAFFGELRHIKTRNAFAFYHFHAELNTCQVFTPYWPFLDYTKISEYIK